MTSLTSPKPIVGEPEVVEDTTPITVYDLLEMSAPVRGPLNRKGPP